MLQHCTNYVPVVVALDRENAAIASLARAKWQEAGQRRRCAPRRGMAGSKKVLSGRATTPGAAGGGGNPPGAPGTRSGQWLLQRQPALVQSGRGVVSRRPSNGKEQCLIDHGDEAGRQQPLPSACNSSLWPSSTALGWPAHAKHVHTVAQDVQEAEDSWCAQPARCHVTHKGVQIDGGPCLWGADGAGR